MEVIFIIGLLATSWWLLKCIFTKSSRYKYQPKKRYSSDPRNNIKWNDITQNKQDYYDVYSKFNRIYKQRKNFNLCNKKLLESKNYLFSINKKEAEEILDSWDHQTKLQGLQPMKLKTKSILNQSEIQVFYQLLGFLKRETDGKKFALYPQVSLRSLIDENKESEFYYIVGSRYVDFLITEIKQNSIIPRCIIEYFGSGHYGLDSQEHLRAERSDEIKKQICEKINLPFIIIKSNETDWKEQLRKILITPSPYSAT